VKVGCPKIQTTSSAFHARIRPSIMSLSLRIGLGAVFGLAVLTFIGYAALLQLNVLPRLAFAPGWSLVGHTGQRVTSEDLRGKIAVYTFDYTSNQDPARQTGAVMRSIRERLSQQELGDVKVRLVTMSVDPERDRPATLQQFHRDTAEVSIPWDFVTGDSAAVRVAVNYGFGIYYEPTDDGRISFDPTFVIVDGLGIERARYRFGLPSPEDVVADLMSVVREAQAKTGSSRLAYEAAHLFSCYAPPSR
jgi:protein SCO1/2